MKIDFNFCLLLDKEKIDVLCLLIINSSFGGLEGPKTRPKRTGIDFFI